MKLTLRHVRTNKSPATERATRTHDRPVGVAHLLGAVAEDRLLGTVGEGDLLHTVGVVFLNLT